MGKKMITIDGYDFPFDDELLRKYAERMGDPLFSPIILKSDITAYAETVKGAVDLFGIEGSVKLAEDRIRYMLSTMD